MKKLPAFAPQYSWIVCLLLLSTFSYAQQGKLMQRYINKKMNKNAADNVGPEPDYSNLYYWAASPYKHDPADSIPSFLKNEKRDSLADVFFIHPTTFIGADGDEQDASTLAEKPMQALKSMENAAWNADLRDNTLNNNTDLRPVLYQATAFNGSCRIFAPRYRQANLKAFIASNSPEAKAALELAYQDVKKAFQYYLDHDNHGRPIIIASHSQGTHHAIRLLKEFFDGSPLQKQLVAAYIIGYQVKKDTFAHIPPCNMPNSTGCFVTWRTFQKGEISRTVKAEQGNSVCTNPLTWTTAQTIADSTLNTGALLGGFNILHKHAIGAEVEPSAKILWVTVPSSIPDKYKKIKNLHVLDYNLFWMNIRENVGLRVKTFVTK